jgi:hypothetical protein
MPTPHFERGKEGRGDAFKPPYNPNLYVGELQDEDEGTEYVVLVSEFGLAIWENSVNANRRLLARAPLRSMHAFVAQQVLCRQGAFSPCHQRYVLADCMARHVQRLQRAFFDTRCFL